MTELPDSLYRWIESHERDYEAESLARAMSRARIERDEKELKDWQRKNRIKRRTIERRRQRNELAKGL